MLDMNNFCLDDFAAYYSIWDKLATLIIYFET